MIVKEDKFQDIGTQENWTDLKYSEQGISYHNYQNELALHMSISIEGLVFIHWCVARMVNHASLFALRHANFP